MHSPASAAPPPSSAAAGEVHRGGALVQRGLLHAHARGHRQAAAGRRQCCSSPQSRIRKV